MAISPTWHAPGDAGFAVARCIPPAIRASRGAGPAGSDPSTTDASASAVRSTVAGRGRRRHRCASDKAIKHFTAFDPVAKWTVAKVFTRATAASAKLYGLPVSRSSKLHAGGLVVSKEPPHAHSRLVTDVRS
jgi:hypothetical protein